MSDTLAIPRIPDAAVRVTYLLDTPEQVQEIAARVGAVAYFAAVAALTLAWFGVGEWLLRRRERRLYVVRGEVVSLDAHRAQRRDRIGGAA